MRAASLALLIAVAALGCSATPGAITFGTGGNSTGPSGTTGTAGTGGHGTGATGTGATGNGGGIGLGGGLNVNDGGSGGGCSMAATLVYVFSQEGDIYSFDPPSKVFTKVATPGCPQGSENSMAIDRNLVAWLNYIGFIYTFDLKTNGPCLPSNINLPAGFTQVGMGFSTDAVGGTAETLYIDGIGGGGLAKVDMNTKMVVPIGAFSNDANLTGQSCELTGTGDARLFGYFTTFPNVRVAQIDKTNANIISDHELVGVPPPSDWAFSFWGGDFYLYAAPGTNSTGNSSVIHYNPTTQAVDTVYVADTGMHIVGAGVSTCAPTMPPQ